MKTKKPILWGVGGGLSLLAVYFLILTLVNSFSHALEQFQLLYLWILVLAIGFGLQAGLYVYVRQEIRQRQLLEYAKKEVAATAGITTGSMIACCAHHLVDLLPILGLSALFLFLAEYQVLFLTFGVVSNVVGVIFMLEIIKRHSLYEKNGFLDRICRFNLRAFKKLALAGSVLILLVVFFLIRRGGSVESSITPAAFTLSSVTNEAGELAIEVEPLDFSFSTPARFKINLNTHQGDLDFDLTKKAVLIDGRNRQYLPLSWEGERGGHHLSGTLVFSVIEKTEKMKLIISDVYEIKEREFSWDLTESR